MDTRETAPFDVTALQEASYRFAQHLFAVIPELERHASMERFSPEQDWALVVSEPAPSGADEARLTIWMDGGEEPSVEFGRWHTHEGCWRTGYDQEAPFGAITDLIVGIRSDRFVVLQDRNAAGSIIATILDTREPDAILEEVTSKYSSGRGSIRSWTGKLDRELDVTDLDLDCAT